MLGNIVLIVAIVLVLCETAGMLELVPKIVAPAVMFPFITVLVLLASALRRRGRAAE